MIFPPRNRHLKPASYPAACIICPFTVSPPRTLSSLAHLSAIVKRCQMSISHPGALLIQRSPFPYPQVQIPSRQAVFSAHRSCPAFLPDSLSAHRSHPAFHQSYIALYFYQVPAILWKTCSSPSPYFGTADRFPHSISGIEDIF